MKYDIPTEATKLAQAITQPAFNRLAIPQVLAQALREAHEAGWVAGAEMQRKLLRLRLGLAVETDT